MIEPGARPTVTALVCTLNEEETVGQVLAAIPEWVDEILVVDGRSTDGTLAAIAEVCPRARVLTQPGAGKGDALKFGIRQSVGEVVVMLDADGETDPADLPHFVRALAGGYDVAKGSRLSQGRPRRMPRYRWFGNKVLAVTFSLLYGVRYTDICSGYNAFRKEAFLSLPLELDGFAMEQLFLARAHKAGLRIVEVPHPSDGRIAGVSKTSGVRQGFEDWFVIIGERFRR